MIAVILAAGRGTRLDTITRNKPKCLVHVNGKALLDRQIKALLSSEDITRVIVLCGYRAQQIKNHLANNYIDEPRLDWIENSEYASTNNMYSLYLARHQIANQDLILMNADVAFSPDIIHGLVQTHESSICVEKGAYAEESMKVVAKDNRLVSISKTILPEDAYGVSIDIYRFTPQDTQTLLDEVVSIIEVKNKRNEWTELALCRLMEKGSLIMRPFDIGEKPWYEIDNLEDLQNAEVVFGQYEFDWKEIRLAFIDMDGTLFKGAQPIIGASDFIDTVSKLVPNIYFLSNNSSKEHNQYVKKLSKMGIKAQKEQILLSSDALITYLRQKNIQRVYAVGTQSFVELLQQNNIEHSYQNPAVVVLAYDIQLTYQKLCEASLLLHNLEMPYLATHSDIVCPTENGDIPDIGAITALIEKTTGRLPQLIFGKPNPNMVKHVFESLEIQPSETVFIGDRVYTDYKMAQKCQSKFIGVLSGDSTRADYENCTNISIFPSVADIFSTSE